MCSSLSSLRAARDEISILARAWEQPSILQMYGAYAAAAEGGVLLYAVMELAQADLHTLCTKG